MTVVGKWMVQISLAAMIGGIATALIPQGSFRKWMRTVCGAVFAVLLLRPVGQVTIPQFPEWEQFMDRTDTDRGIAAAKQAQLDIILPQLEAYILDKGRSMGAQLQVLAIECGDDLVPVAIELTGTVPDTVREELSRFLAEELGIPKENQLWNVHSGDSPSNP